MINCPNCAAPVNPQENKCPYCGTSYFDMSAIDIDHGEPFYLKLKLNGMVITQKVVARPDIEITVSNDYADVISGNNKMVSRYSMGSNLSTNITFEAVADYKNKNTLCTIIKEN